MRTGGIFYFPWHRHQIEGTNGFYCLIRKTLASGVNGIAKVPKRKVFTEVGLEPSNVRSPVDALTHSATAPPRKEANVAPIFKKGDKHNPCNYRLISLTCIICKCMEHILVSNITQHLDSNKILYARQHGFRKKLSCDIQLLSLFQDLSSNPSQTDMVIMDFSKAFDKVPHRPLSRKRH